MLSLHKTSIRNKLRIIILLTSGVVLLLASGAFIASDLLTSRRGMIADLLMLADLVGINSAAPLMFNKAATAEENIAALKANPHIIVTYIFSSTGELFVSYVKEGMNVPSPISNDALQSFLHKSGELNQRQRELYSFQEDYLEVFKEITYKNLFVGTVYIQSDLEELHERLMWAGIIVVTIFLASLLLAFILALYFQKLITTPLYNLLETIHIVSVDKNYTIRAKKTSQDELGSLVEGFNTMLARIERHDRELAEANLEITALNHRLKAENLRMSAELDVSRRLQQMLLPKDHELKAIRGLDIVGFMQPADEVGGDYYDVLHYDDHIKISIGDVTGHGLESGVLMLMVQIAVRTLLAAGIHNPKVFLTVLNRVIYDNIKRIDSDKNLTFCMLDYQDHIFRLSGQHEEVIVIRHDGKIQHFDTFDLGFIIGLKTEISEFVDDIEIELAVGDTIVLYTDGITEAIDSNGRLYGIERLDQVLSENWQKSAADIQLAVINDVQKHIGNQKIFDDITLLVCKQLS